MAQVRLGLRAFLSNMSGKQRAAFIAPLLWAARVKVLGTFPFLASLYPWRYSLGLLIGPYHLLLVVTWGCHLWNLT